MSNNYRPHLFVLPEDRADSEVANGFLKYPFLASRVMRVLNPAGGWLKVIEDFESNEIAKMRLYPERFMVLLFDFDNHVDRIDFAKGKVPLDIAERVLILGSLLDPENLSSAGLGKFEEIGFALAKDCREDTNNVWGHELLRHNAGELQRLRKHIHPILFA